MKCDRCGRPMVYKHFFGNQEHFRGWRFVFCGEIVDDVILENRQGLKKGIVSDNKKARRRGEVKMKSVESFCKRAIEMGIEDAKIIKPGSVVTAEWVRLKCQYGCPGFGESLCCPPRTPTPDMTRKIIDSYQKAILLHQRLPKWKPRWAKFDNFSKSMVRLEIEIFLDGYYKAWSMGCGPCDLCKECNLPGSCQHGLEARPSMEACGIDVFKTARDNGLPIEVVRKRDAEMNIFALVLVE